MRLKLVSCRLLPAIIGTSAEIAGGIGIERISRNHGAVNEGTELRARNSLRANDHFKRGIQQNVES